MEESPAATHPRIAVAGLWHLGCVTAACLADASWPVLALDSDPAVIAGLRDDHPPLSEPGLAELVAQRRGAGELAFAEIGDPASASAEIVWLTFDTPVDDEDRADVEWVLAQSQRALVEARHGALVVSSSQLPVGSVAELDRRMAALGRADLHFACVPENLRLGRAIEVFTETDRFVAGVRSEADRVELAPLLGRFTDRIEWMGVESAEMTKHALNAFLATSVAFINEVAAICERVGADGAEVARGLKSEARIGPRAYLSPGDAFAGGTLARDIVFLGGLAEREGLPAGLVTGVRESNIAHRGWARRTLQTRFADGGLAGRRIAVWGLTYKPGTSTLRRSSSLELCDWLAAAGADVVAYDPAIGELPPEHSAIGLTRDALTAARDADALVVSTPWPEFRELAAEELLAALADAPLVLDAGSHLAATLGEQPAERVTYLRVGVSAR
jgi:UDPglucose 6-dehydrogenase